MLCSGVIPLTQAPEADTTYKAVGLFSMCYSNSYGIDEWVR